jgi:hypothetical protein
MRKRILSASSVGVFASTAGAVTANAAGAGFHSAVPSDALVTAVRSCAPFAGPDIAGPADEPGWQ